MRKIVSGGSPSPFDLLRATGLAFLFLFLAGWYFTRIYRYVLRSGLIARYSAESVS
jgi:ABC-2 type transport system permease protein